jgi:DNA-binding beta-propeller fold protein YncE
MSARRAGVLAACCLLLHATMLGGARGVAQAQDRAAYDLEATYRVYVVAESEDLVHRLRVGPDGAHVEHTVSIGELLLDIDGPHGIAVDARGGFVYVTTAHGIQDGKLWKLEVGPDTAVAAPLLLGRFPASLDVTPDGLFALVANFNLHGEMAPSSISAVYLPDFVEVARTETCTMPHGSRFGADGRRHYSVCMMDDQLVEIETRTFAVQRRFSVHPQHAGPIASPLAAAVSPDDRDVHARHGAGGPNGNHEPVCSPTWASPSPDGARVYVACNRADVVLEIDIAEWRLLRRFETGRGPYNLEVTPDGRLLVVTLKQGHAVELIDLERGQTTQRIDASTRVTHGVALSPDSRLAFISVEGVGAEPGRVDVIDLRNGRRIHSFEVGLQAAGIAFLDMQPAKPTSAEGRN